MYCELRRETVALLSVERARRLGFNRSSIVEWHDVAAEYEERTWEHNNHLSSLPAEWQRELVALRRLNRNVNNGGYLQFFVNCGRESYVYASLVLKKMGTAKIATIIDNCQALIDEHFPAEGATSSERDHLLPNRIIDREGKTVKDVGSVLPDSVLARLSELSHEYIYHPDDFGDLANDYFRPHLKNG
jgi:hypothetical protein